MANLELCCMCDQPTGRAGKGDDSMYHEDGSGPYCEDCNDHDLCGYCGEHGADKMALWTGGGVYWPGEKIPDTRQVHADCENEETRRAHAALTPEQIRRVLWGL